MTPEQTAAIAARNEARNQIINKLSYDLWEVYTDNDPEAGTKNNRVWDLLLAFHDKIANNQAAEVARLTAVIEHDRSKVVDVLAEANAVLKNYGWLADGRGSYAFDDDRWKDEFKACMDCLAKVLDPMRGIASDLSDSPIKWADIVAARSMTDALAEAEQRGYDAAKEQAKQQVRHDCQACSGTGHADADTECEYCGRPMQSIAAMVKP